MEPNKYVNIKTMFPDLQYYRMLVTCKVPSLVSSIATTAMIRITRMTNTPSATPAAIMSHSLSNSSPPSSPSLADTVGGSSVSVTSTKLHYSHFLITLNI